MSTLTTRLGLYKPAASGSELVNVVTDLNNNLDSLDAKVGAFACTSGTRPASPYDGQIIRETDTGKLMLWDTSAWRQILYHTAQFANSISTTGGLTFNGAAEAVESSSANEAFRAKVSTDTQQRFIVLASGSIFWGPGGSTATDTNLYRAGADTLKTDDAFQVGGALTVTGASSFADVNVSGNLNIGSARYRTQLSSVTTVANTVAESVLAIMTVPANDAAVGAVYRISAWGTASVTGTPTLTFRSRVGGLGGTLHGQIPAITIRSGMPDGGWRVVFEVAVISTGAGGTWASSTYGGHNFITSATTWTPIGPYATGALTSSTTVSNDLEITCQWSAASASNTITCRGFSAERVA